MARLLIYDAYENKVYTYANLNENDPMPYSTGTTLRENGLKVVTEFLPISARFIANKASYQFKHAEMDTMLEKLRAQLQNKEEAK